jgi:hypothetical protein
MNPRGQLVDAPVGGGPFSLRSKLLVARLGLIQFLPIAIPLVAYAIYFWLASDIVGVTITALLALVSVLLGFASFRKDKVLFGATIINNRVFYRSAQIFFLVFVLELAYFGLPLPHQIEHAGYGLPIVHHVTASSWLLYLFAPLTPPRTRLEKIAFVMVLLFPPLSGVYLGNRGMMLISALVIFLRASQMTTKAVVFVVVSILLFNVLGELRFPMEFVTIDAPLGELDGIWKSWFSLYLFGSIWSSLQASVWPGSYITNFTNTYWEFGYFFSSDWLALVLFLFVWLISIRVNAPLWARKIMFVKIILSTFAVSILSTTTISIFILAATLNYFGKRNLGRPR